MLVNHGPSQETGCEIIRGAPTTLVVKGFMMIMMMTLDKRDKTFERAGFSSSSRRDHSAGGWRGDAAWGLDCQAVVTEMSRHHEDVHDLHLAQSPPLALLLRPLPEKTYGWGGRRVPFQWVGDE